MQMVLLGIVSKSHHLEGVELRWNEILGYMSSSPGKMKSLELVNLPRLKSFCSGNHTFEFPCLEEVIVRGCPEMEIFCKGNLNSPLLRSVEYGRDKGLWSGDINSTVQHLHSTKVWYQGIGYFVLSEFSKSIEIWNKKSLDFKNRKVLEVEECNSLKYIFSVSMALELVQLTYLKVKNCPMVEYIVKKGTEKTTIDTLLLPRLCRIKLKSCSELTSFVWEVLLCNVHLWKELM
ncbi:hypothetical protein V6N11_079532 [Hibiscus sabdariffa]|uniref:Disease resistance protein At4g27190-like leucine-rich repeats domain-containing protein n=1 Tax=Hibiscus sabdariffa TaxID=183260 RepID=A0ABR2RW15_9ROSI